MKSGTRIVSILTILFGGILSTCALFLSPVLSFILSVLGRVLIVIGMLILFVVQNEN